MSILDREVFIKYRKKLAKTQKELAELLGVSIKTLHSYEQGWRSIPAHAERQILFLLSRIADKSASLKPCWTVKNCPAQRKKQCPAWEFQAGKLCWFINGTICDCAAQKNWHEKMAVCRECEAFKAFMGDIE